ncbi:MAG TPA: phosphoribosylanthranilate isomerase [Verrucomicrobiales bacterium]|nr:phosphoribosylanthranilate isomerase [Verrucomicrobiales bacterium]
MTVAPFLSRITRRFVKVCGLTRYADAEVCAQAGVDAIGINFFPRSKRFHPLAQAREWLEAFSGNGAPARIALFVNAGLDEIRAAVETGLFEAVQLHGDETPEFEASVKALGLPVVRGLALQTESDIARLAEHPADGFILDSPAPGVYGGTGHLCDWSLAAAAVSRYPNRPILLSGGLTPENVAAAVLEVSPFGVDVASGVESEPGVKDHAKIRAFAALAKGESTNTRLFP